MPKIVDHEQRRLELVEATWRIIARRGIEGTTLREIAAEAGFANGALKPYFPTKDALLDVAFAHVFQRTNRRMEDATAGGSGLAALRASCHEILPLDTERLNEASIVIAFWQKAFVDPTKASLHEDFMERWREGIRIRLREAGILGELGGKPLTDDAVEDITGLLMTFLLGAQITATFSPSHHAPAQLISQLDRYLRAMAAGSMESDSLGVGVLGVLP